MAKCAISDPQDWEVWQAIHGSWAGLINAEMDDRRGRGLDVYRELIASFGNFDTSNSATRGSSSSTLTDVQAFERGYR